MNIYEVKQHYLELFRLLDDPETDQESLQAALNDQKSNFDEYAKNKAAYIKNMYLTAESLKKAEKELYDRRKDIENSIEKSEKSLLKDMNELNIKNVDHDLFNIKIRECPVSLVYDNESSIPEIYFDTKTIASLNKNKVKDALSKGIIIEGCSLINRKTLVLK